MVKGAETAKAVAGVLVVPRFDELERSEPCADRNDLDDARGLLGVMKELAAQLEVRQKKAEQDTEKGGFELPR